jgi:Tfp pilus assembly protein PilF
MIDPGRQQRLSALASSYDGCQRQYSALQSEARQVAAVREAFAQQLVPINANMDRLSREADQLRADWLTATDAYGYLRRREYDRAMAIFEEWIGMEPAYFEPYVARGMTQYQLGRKDLADLDFRKANVLDRRNAEIKKRELRKSLGYKG